MLSDPLTSPCVVIGDLVGSRRSRDRMALHQDLVNALATANRLCHPAEPLAPTVGDEFQGVFHNLYDAVDATLVVRVSMSAEHDARFGVGVGPVTPLGSDGRPQDGPGWWEARAAIDYVASNARSRDLPRTSRTWISVADVPPAGRTYAPVELPRHPLVAALNAYLLARDQLVSQMDGRDRRILRGLLAGQPVHEIATAEGISSSAVSQRIHRSGATAVAASRDTLPGFA